MHSQNHHGVVPALLEKWPPQHSPMQIDGSLHTYISFCRAIVLTLKPSPLWRTFFQSEAATVHRLKKHSQPCDSQALESKRLCAPPMAPLNQNWDSSVASPKVDNDQPWLNGAPLSVPDAVIVCIRPAGSSQPPCYVLVCYLPLWHCGMPMGMAVPAASSGFQFSSP